MSLRRVYLFVSSRLKRHETDRHPLFRTLRHHLPLEQRQARDPFARQLAESADGSDESSSQFLHSTSFERSTLTSNPFALLLTGGIARYVLRRLSNQDSIVVPRFFGRETTDA